MFVAGCFFTIHHQQYYCASSTLGFGKVVDQIHSQEHSTFQHVSWPTKVSYVLKVSFWGKIIIMPMILNIKEQSCFEKPSIPGPIAKQLTMHYSFIILKHKYSKKKCAKKLSKSLGKFLTLSISETLRSKACPPKKSSHHPTPTSVGVLPATSLLQHGIFKVPNPIGSMGGLVYLPTFTHKNQPNVGQSTVRPMDPYGLSTKNSRLNLSCFFLKRF